VAVPNGGDTMTMRLILYTRPKLNFFAEGQKAPRKMNPYLDPCILEVCEQ
jgi:hypothetical protein